MKKNYHFIIDPKKGKKWFVFYTKIRPWILFLSGMVTLLVLMMVVLFPGYFDHPAILVISYVVSLVNVVFQLAVFVKSFGDYFDFVTFVKIALIVESFSIFLSSILNGIANGDDEIVIVIVAFFAAIMCFVWYRVNFKYFDKRLVCTNPPSKEEAEQYFQNKSAVKASRENSEYNVKSAEALLKAGSFQPQKNAPSHICLGVYDPKDPNPNEGILLQPQKNKSDELDLEIVEYDCSDNIENCDDKIEEVKTPNFCRKCGNKLTPGSIFCSNCGTKIN